MEEEREKELEQVYESTLVSQMEKADVNDNMEVDAAGIQTMETLKAGERIMEAIDIGDEERKGWEDYETVRIVYLPVACVLMRPMFVCSPGEIQRLTGCATYKKHYLGCYGRRYP